jgi:hypothetical protein
MNQLDNSFKNHNFFNQVYWFMIGFHFSKFLYDWIEDLHPDPSHYFGPTPQILHLWMLIFYSVIVIASFGMNLIFKKLILVLNVLWLIFIILISLQII